MSDSFVVAGALNVDIIAEGVEEVARESGDTTEEPLRIEAGGKAHNIAVMISRLTEGEQVSMLGRISRDPFGFWQLPIDSLEEAGVETKHVRKLRYEESGHYPGVALSVVDETGRNQIYLASGANQNFSPEDVKRSKEAFEDASGDGFLATTLIPPTASIKEAVKKAEEYGLRTILDPGGANADEDYSDLLEHPIYLLKPNAAEAERLTGVEVEDFESAEEAADKLLDYNIENVLITAGPDGAYFFNQETSRHIPAPELELETGEKDETGCGDQVVAAICSALREGKSIEEAAKKALIAGTLQFHRAGIRPVYRDKLEEFPVSDYY